MEELMRFFYRPAFHEEEIISLKEKLKEFLKVYLFCFAFIIVSGFFIIILEHIIKSAFHLPSPRKNYALTMKEIYNRFGNFSPVIILLLVPIYEELIFRLYLNLKKISISISVALLTYGLTGPIWSSPGQETHFLWRITIMILIFIFLNLTIPDNLLNHLGNNYFKYVFYFSVLLFGLIHISNFKPLNEKLFFLYPIFILPQIGMGLSLGYIRIKLKNGMLWAILFHSLINLPGLLFHFI